jgi:hypothetical protein
MQMKKPYRVQVWGSGKMGAVAIWEVLQSPAFELVGVRVYSDAKDGMEVGDVLGIEPVGITATMDAESLLGQECDCVIYTALDTGDFNTDPEILQLLASGKNVVTPLPYQNAQLFRDQGFRDALADACRQGASVFHATGIDPDIISERVLMALTGLCTDISSIKLQEFWECSGGEPSSLAFIGFGKSVEEARQIPIAAAASTNFLKAITYTAEKVLGVKFDRVVEENECIAAPQDIDGGIFIEKGGVARFENRMMGYIDAKGPEPFFTMEYNWFMGYEMLPEGIQPDQYWVASIEGRPSLKMSIDLKASIETQQRFYEIGKIKSEPGYHGTIAPCLQAIPHICAAAPGVIPSFGPGLHWMQDLRDSVVGATDG